MAKKLDYEKIQKALFKRTEGYAYQVRKIYEKVFTEIIEMVKNTELIDGVPFSFSEYGYSEKVTPLLRKMYSEVYQLVRTGVIREFEFSNKTNDDLVSGVFGESAVMENHFAQYFVRNQAAMDAFFSRKVAGMNLSQRVWNLTSAFKEELEMTLDLAIGEGTPSMQVASKVKKYLNEPDRWYRRFRIKIGEDENGESIFGRIWKRRVFDKETNSYKWINANPKDYHPGPGVYRSSARNAQRMTRTETNMAYRTADHERWNRFDFVVGFEVKMTKDHPCYDICDELAGYYPKDFKYVGWHPNCRCYAVPVLASEEEMDQILETAMAGEKPQPITNSVNQVRKLPNGINDWMKANKERYQDAMKRGKLPYFIRDNQQYFAKYL